METIFGNARCAMEFEELSTSSTAADKAFAHAIANSEKPFKELIAKYEYQIRVQVSRFAHQEIDRSGLVNEVFFQVYVSLKNYRGKSSLSAWIDTITTRVCHRFLRSRYREKIKQEMLERLFIHKASGESVSASSSGFDARDRLEKCLGKLKPDDRIVLTLVYWEDCSISDVAKRLGWGESKTKVRVHRARQKLRSILENSDEI